MRCERLSICAESGSRPLQIPYRIRYTVPEEVLASSTARLWSPCPVSVVPVSHSTHYLGNGLWRRRIVLYDQS